MSNTWGPSKWGKSLTTTIPWQIALSSDEISIAIRGHVRQVHIMVSQNIQVKPGIFWATVTFKIDEKKTITLDGIPNDQAQAMLQALQNARNQHQHRIKIKDLLANFSEAIQPVLSWSQGLVDAAKLHLKSKGWLTEEFLQSWATRKPGSELPKILNEPELKAHLEKQSDAVKGGIRLWQRDLPEFVTGVNNRHLESELVACKSFFDTVEKSQLTEEQARAVVCFDNRVLVVASAGSGKTSTMVAKAGYALHRGFIDADKILLLAFNNEAAKELQQRIRDRLEPLGFPADKIVARTFHAFGLDVIGAATGKKPTLAPWLESNGDLRELMVMIDVLKDTDIDFRTQWDLFRIVLGRDLPTFGKEEEAPEDWDRDTRASGFRTLQGEVVKSQGERLIADWLFYNGVEYRYEVPYPIDTADQRHRQYRPDFYLPAIDAYYEHWALDDEGIPPVEFTGYLDGVKWKRELHLAQKTALLETTMAQLWSGHAFKYLAKELTQRGVVLDPNPDRAVNGRRPLENDELVRTFRTFLTHAKGNRINDQDLMSKLQAEGAGRFRFRHETFLRLFFHIRKAWESRLAQEKVIDFEDMLNMAADHLEAGKWTSPFELVMVDEFQDASRARARITRALINSPGKYLFAVGDDWQSINRFAGADLAVMTEFERWFGKGQTLRLERTFRCPQSICDVSSGFVLKNPAQLRKKVVSTTQEYSPSISAREVPDEGEIQGAIRAYLIELHQQVVKGEIPAGKNGALNVFVLGRYRRDEAAVPRWDDLSPALNVKFMTIHGSKGLEADYVVIPRLASGSYGFPSTIVDDPVLQLAMPGGEEFSAAEERRLFYVALTRARRSVLLITLQHKHSSFGIELAKDFGVTPTSVNGQAANAHVCPRCSKGTMIPRTGKYGPFLGCSQFPKCKMTLPVK
jgi:DNA helicase IV